MARTTIPPRRAAWRACSSPVDRASSYHGEHARATDRPIDWFKRSLINHVPFRTPAWSAALPGFLRALGELEPRTGHKEQFKKLYEHLVDGDVEKADTIRNFYDEIPRGQRDLPAEFYIETVERVFQTYDLPRGELTVGDRKVNPAAIRKTALLTVGRRDDICAVGQTVAAQDLCPNIRPYLKAHHLRKPASDTTACSATPLNTQIYPRVRETIYAAAELLIDPRGKEAVVALVRQAEAAMAARDGGAPRRSNEITLIPETGS